MKAMILCAGRGERLRPLTDHTPKPLIEVANEPLLGRHLRRLSAAGFLDVVINSAYLASQIADFVGDGSDWNLRAQVIYEGTEALETGGGMKNALPSLGDAPFAAINGDIWTDLDFALIRSIQLASNSLAHLFLVDNPPHNPNGDFGLDQGTVVNDPKQYTFSGMGIYRPELFAEHAANKFSVAPLLRTAADQRLISGHCIEANWFDIGSQDRLQTTRLFAEAASR